MHRLRGTSANVELTDIYSINFIYDIKLHKKTLHPDTKKAKKPETLPDKDLLINSPAIFHSQYRAHFGLKFSTYMSAFVRYEAHLETPITLFEILCCMTM